MKTWTSRALRWATGIGLIVGVLASCGGGEDAALGGIVRTPPLQVAEVSLPDVSAGGTPTSMRAPDGELYLVYFGYTSCPDVCPTTLSDIRVALDGLPDDRADRVTVAMATVDPVRDTDDVLTGYLAHFFDHSIALRTIETSPLEVATAAFGVKYEIADHEPGDAYDVSHTAITYVVDSTGTVVLEWPFGYLSADMTSDLNILLDKEN